MRAISCAAPGELALVDVERPALKPGWVRVGISHIGICGTDYHIYEGKHPFLQYPRIMGHELSGVVLDPNGAVTLTAGGQISHYFDLPNTTPTGTGSLNVRSEPPRARVTVDGQPFGRTPTVVNGLTPGPHQVILEGKIEFRQTRIALTRAASTQLPVDAP